MNLSQHKASVGFFSLSGLALLVIGIIVLGGGQLFSNDTEYVLYFGSSVSGLSVGAPVVFRGVPLGSVTRISLVANANKSNVVIPVHIRINSRNLLLASGQAVNRGEEEVVVIKDMVSKGMCGRLQIASLITGQYRIELDFFPNTRHSISKRTESDLEIPTVASPIDTFQKTLERIPMEEVIANVESTLLQVKRILESGEIERGLKGFADTFALASSLLTGLQDIPTLATKAMQNVESSSSTAKQEIPAALSSFRSAMDNFSAATAQLRQISDSTNKTFGPNSPAIVRLGELLKDATAAMRSLRILTETLERNPESVIRGRKGAY